MTGASRSRTWEDLRAELSATGLFTGLDLHFAGFIARLAETDSSAVPLAAALASRKTGEGNVCLDLGEFAGGTLETESDEENVSRYVCPALEDWTDQLQRSRVAGSGKDSTPLVLETGNKLYLRRYWEYEQSIVGFLLRRAGVFVPDADISGLKADVEKLFQPRHDIRTDWQKVGAITAVTSLFSVISGGPGTGKTTTVARILALLLSREAKNGKPRIVLAAPTGKAAARLHEAIVSTGLFDDKTEIPQTTTVHRLLGPIPHSPYFRRNRENPLNAGVIILDEASMVDLPLMAKLMQAVPDSARLILLGDRHQLASVQPGSVLGDICRTEIMESFSETFRQRLTEISGEKTTPQKTGAPLISAPGLQDSFIELVDNYRFPGKNTIARLSRAVKDGDGELAVKLLSGNGDSQVLWSDVPSSEALEEKLRSWSGLAYASMPHADDPETYFAALDDFRILCGLRRGPYGMQRVNSLLSRLLGPDCQPVMVTRNDYDTNLFNGDVGVILRDSSRGKGLRAYFRNPDGTLRDMEPAMLPEHETAFAMTVHKSQGSEFSRLLLILPDQDSPLLTRELLYTAITRAREKVEIWGRKEIFRAAVKRRINRTSGLADKLWGKDDLRMPNDKV